MTINNKKFWALMLALVMILSVFTLCASAEDEAEGNDIPSNEIDTGLLTTTSEDGEIPTNDGDILLTTSEGDDILLGAETTDTDTGDDTTEDETWVSKHMSFIIATAVIVFLAIVYFALRLFSKKFREKTTKFWKDYNAEFKKLVWPTKQQLVKNSAVTIITIIVFAAVLALIDFGLAKGIYALKDLFDLIRPAK